MVTNRRRSRTRSPRSARKSPSAIAPAPNHNPAFDLRDDEIESALQTGAYAGLLEDYFGPAQYAELRQLKRDAQARKVRGGPKVLVLPGIMGSKIGRDRFGPFDDVLWVDPLAIHNGKLTDLAWPDGGKYKAVGVMLIAYLKLKLRLDREGYDADFYPFDWRRSIDDLGTELKNKLQTLGDDVSLVAHSMGGLVARAAIKQGAKFRKLIMLGTPNHGAFAPVLALRGTYEIVRKLDWLDKRHSAVELSRDVFSTFPGLTQMLPFKGHYDGVDLYDVNVWPEAKEGYAPRPALLREAARVQQTLAPGGQRMFMIAGVDQKTVVGIRVAANKKEFEYVYSPDGDGTVPLKFARLPGVKATYYVSETHGSLPNNGTVAKAVLDLLEKDTTDALASTYERPRDRGAVDVRPEHQLRVPPYEGKRGSTLSQRELRELIEEVAAPDAHEALELPAVLPPAQPGAGAPAPGFEHPFDRVRVGRANIHRIDVRFGFGSITEADTRAIALGLFRDVAPSGAAGAVDKRMNGAVSDMYRRRMFSANVGEVFMLPTGRHQLVTDFVVFVGLGPFDQFTDEVLQTASENTIRTLISARIEEFATVLYGGSSGESPASSLTNMLIGFLRGLRDADQDHHFRRIVICERDRNRYVAIKEELLRLSSTTLCEGVEMTFDEKPLPPEPVIAASTRVSKGTTPVYLIVRQERVGAASMDIRSSLLTAGDKAAIVTGVRRVETNQLGRALADILNNDAADFTTPGPQLANLVLAKDVLTVLPRFRNNPLVIVHDAPTSRIPWDTIGFGEDKKTAWFPAAERGLSHRYAAENLSVAKWLEERVKDNVLNVLLIVNPTGDLSGAEREGKRVRAQLGQQPGCKLTVLRRDQATRQAVLAGFSSGQYDIIHYAGHAEFNPRHPSRSGIVCANDVRLTGADLASVSRLPTLVFFNACESARLRGPNGNARKAKKKKLKSAAEHIVDNVGFAEAFMRGGVANFLGTYWPVGDDAADKFSEVFYSDIIAGKSVGEALLNGREEVRKLDSPDWANYIFYGNTDFILKEAT
jgi:CHAT domain-containing protein/pimeloyl-ACP methyl ester carboxylesterase